MGSLKDEFGKIFKLAFVEDNKPLETFLDKAGIYKKPNYKKEIAENLKRKNDLTEKQLMGK